MSTGTAYLRASSHDKDRSLYLALLEIFSFARIAACDFKAGGWSLHACYTEPEDVMTRYGTDHGSTIEMVSTPNCHTITFIRKEQTDGH